VEFYNAIALGEQGVVAADADEFTCMEFGAALTDKDVAREVELVAVAFDTKALAS
jgi:hypothetical protein